MYHYSIKGEIIMKQVYKISIFFVALVMVLSACAPAATPTIAPSPVVPTPVVIARVSLDDAKAAFDAGTAVFVDVRPGSSYEASHIQGAVSNTYDDSFSMEKLDPASWIITYCT
jgi:hypothetical protein